MLGDLNIAEPKALIGFAGPRVIEQTIRQKLPDGFQRSEFLIERGMLDLVVDRRELKPTIARALRFMTAAPMTPRERLVRPRTVRHQARARQHPHDSRRAEPARARLASACTSPAPTARVGHGDGRARPARGRPSHRPLHVAASRPHRGAHRHRRRARRRRRASTRPRPTCSTSSIACATTGALARRADVLRGDDGDGLRDLPPRRRHSGGRSKSASAAASTRPT